MAKLTVTEALAEIKLIDAKVQKKVDWITTLVVRTEDARDPVEKEGGSEAVIRKERQAIGDLFLRKIALREAINKANMETILTIEGVERPVSEWLIWRREVSTRMGNILERLRKHIEAGRSHAQRNAASMVTSQEEAKEGDVVVNVSEAQLAEQIEAHETVLGLLDGKLSLLNATTYLEG